MPVFVSRILYLYWEDNTAADSCASGKDLASNATTLHCLFQLQPVSSSFVDLSRDDTVELARLSCVSAVAAALTAVWAGSEIQPCCHFPRKYGWHCWSRDEDWKINRIMYIEIIQLYWKLGLCLLCLCLFTNRIKSHIHLFIYFV